jgi:CRP-like cAMP-binding protein
MLPFEAMASAPREVWGDLATTAFVESSILFKSLAPEAIRDLLQVAHLVTWAPGETISAEGDEGFYLVVEGAAQAVSGGAEVFQVERSGLFGVGRALGAPRPISLVARTDVSAVVFPAPMIAALVERYPRMRKLLEAVRVARDKGAAGPPAP